MVLMCVLTSILLFLDVRHFTRAPAHPAAGKAPAGPYWLLGLIEGEVFVIESQCKSTSPRLLYGLPFSSFPFRKISRHYSTSTETPASGFGFPVKIYGNADTDKLTILTENKKKSRSLSLSK